ncbi:MAG: HD domain-containing protein [Synergistaceae bacterium]|nr:HD domain-containing protein [Synergistaceae bacterium]
MDRKKALDSFRNYVAAYDTKNAGVSLKIAHTYRVAEIADSIARSVAGVEADLAWLLGLLHDIGRFEQITRYGTFKDAFSVDHAELGADILFRDGLIKNFPVLDSKKELVETAIRLHNKLTVPNKLDNETKMYSNILRDADKVDIFRVLTEPPYNERKTKNLTIRNEIMQCVFEHRCVPRMAIQVNELELLASQCCMAFELTYTKTHEIVYKQGYLKKLLDVPELAVVKVEIKKAWEIKNFIFPV